jgi:hypothetical protein
MGCPAGQRCFRRFGFMDMDLDVGFCDAPGDCDLIAQTGCEAAQGCYPLGDDGSVQCIAAGTAAAGDACAAVACAAGNGCYRVNMETTAHCYAFCDTAVADTCGEGFTCSALGYPPPSDNVGICIPMM